MDGHIVLRFVKTHPSILIILTSLALTVSLAIWVCAGINKQKTTVSRREQAYCESPTSPMYRGRSESFLSASCSTAEEFQFVSGDAYRSHRPADNRTEGYVMLAHRNSFRTSKV